MCVDYLRNTTITSTFSSTIENDIPKTKYLDRHVRDKVCASEPRKWEDLGKELLDDDDLPALTARTCNMNEKQCCSEMFKIWLERQPEASWQQLITALHVVKLNRLADNIEKLLIRSPEQSKVHLNQPQNQKYGKSFCIFSTKASWYIGMCSIPYTYFGPFYGLVPYAYTYIYIWAAHMHMGQS